MQLSLHVFSSQILTRHFILAIDTPLKVLVLLLYPLLKLLLSVLVLCFILVVCSPLFLAFSTVPRPLRALLWHTSLLRLIISNFRGKSDTDAHFDEPSPARFYETAESGGVGLAKRFLVIPCLIADGVADLPIAACLLVLCAGVAVCVAVCISGTRRQWGLLRCVSSLSRPRKRFCLLVAIVTLTAGSLGCESKRQQHTGIIWTVHRRSSARTSHGLFPPATIYTLPPSFVSRRRVLPSLFDTVLLRCVPAFGGLYPVPCANNVLLGVCQSNRSASPVASSFPLCFLLLSDCHVSIVSPASRIRLHQGKGLLKSRQKLWSTRCHGCLGISTFSFQLPQISHDGKLAFLLCCSSLKITPSIGQGSSRLSPSIDGRPSGSSAPMSSGRPSNKTSLTSSSSSILFLASSTHLPSESSSMRFTTSAPLLCNQFSKTSASLSQSRIPFVYSCTALQRQIRTFDLGTIKRRRLPLYQSKLLEFRKLAVRRHGHLPETRPPVNEEHLEEDEEEVMTQAPYFSRDEGFLRQRSAEDPPSTEIDYDYFKDVSAVSSSPFEEIEEEGDPSQQLETILPKTSRFGSLTDPGEPPTPPPPSPFWPSYPPKKVSALPCGKLPRWHPRSPFPPLQPRGPFYPQPEQQHSLPKLPPSHAPHGQNETTATTESPIDKDTHASSVGLPEEPPDLPKNYRTWVRDSRYKYPQFTTIAASLRYKRHLKRSSRKLDWRLKNVQFRRMYFAWRRNMRDQEMHRWMRERIQWSKRATEYWKREYSRQEEEWMGRILPKDEPEIEEKEEETAPAAQEKAKASAVTTAHGRLPAGKGETQAFECKQEDSASTDLPVGKKGEKRPLYEGEEQEPLLTVADGVERTTKRGDERRQDNVSRPPEAQAEKQLSTFSSARQADISRLERSHPQTSSSTSYPVVEREGEKVREKGGLAEDRKGEEIMKCKRSVGMEEQDEKPDNGRNVVNTNSDLVSRVLSLLSPAEVRDIIINGYRLPPLSSAVAASPVPWWASCKGEHKWRGRKTATNVQSRWVNWANPHRLIEAAVGRCLIPRQEGGILSTLRKKGEELKQALDRVHSGEDAAAWCTHSINGEKEESGGGLHHSVSDQWSPAEEELKMNGLRKLWAKRKMQQPQKVRKTEDAGNELDVEKLGSQSVFPQLSESDKKTSKKTEQAEPDGEICTLLDHEQAEDTDGKTTGTTTVDQRGDVFFTQGEAAQPKTEHEVFGEKAKRCSERLVFSHSPPSEEVPKNTFIDTYEAKKDTKQQTSSAQRKTSATYLNTHEIAEKSSTKDTTGQAASLDIDDTPDEPLAKVPHQPALQCGPGSNASWGKREDSSPSLGEPKSQNFLDDREKQRRAIQAAIDVSVMLGHSTIVKTHGAASPYDVHSPFIKTHTSSRRRRMRLRGRERDPDKRNMTRQERRIANRDARLEQEKLRKEAARAARRQIQERHAATSPQR